MTDDLEQRLAAAADALRERDILASRRISLAERSAAVREEIDSLRTRAAVEQADVERLENLSLTRILASLKGSREEDLAAEKAQAQAARYRLAEAEARLQTLQAEDEIAAIGQRRLANAQADHDALMREKERRLSASGSPQGRRLLEVAEHLGALRAEMRELREAVQAADEARQALAALTDTLRSARSWSTYDTFFGGGMISSAVKHSRLDEAARQAAYADGRLARLRTELADVPGGVQVPSLAVSSGTRFVDVWFDNIFTDLSVREHIHESLASVERIAGIVSSVHSGLHARTRTAENRVAELEAERLRLLS